MGDDRDLPNPKNIDECNRLLGDASLVLAAQRNRGNTIGLYRIRRVIDHLLDRRNAFTGPPTCGACNRVKDRYGTQVWLCSECDFRRCTGTGENATGCDNFVRRIESLGRGPLTPFGVCPHCGRTL